MKPVYSSIPKTKVKTMKTKIEMTYKKQTKGTVVYGNEDSAIPSVYIKKDIFETGKFPETITITVEAE